MSNKILIISPTPSHPQNAGNRARIYNLLLNLREAGYDVYFVHIEETPGDKASMQDCWGDRFFAVPYVKPETAYRKPSKHIAVKIITKLKALLGSDPRYTYSIDDWYDDRIQDSIAELSKQINPDVVIAEYVFFSKVLESFNANVLKVIDTHDAFTNRYKLYLRNQQTPRWFSTTQKEEKKGLRRADVVVAIQDKEAKFFATLIQPHQRVITVGHFVTSHSLPLSTESGNHSILYIGSRNPINVDGVNWFIQKILPKVRARIMNAKLILAGEICDVVEDFEHGIKLGRVESLEDAYALATIVINPVRFGTGLKIKSIEALGYSKPLVTTPVGAEGLETGIDKAFVVANTSEEFARSIIQLCSDSARYQDLAHNAYAFAKAWNQDCLSALTRVLTPASK